MTDGRLLVPVTDSVTVRNTVAHAVREAQESTADKPSLHFVYPVSRRLRATEDAAEAEELLDRVEVWAGEDSREDLPDPDVTTALVGADQYLFSPGDYAEVLVGYAREHDIETVVLDPEFDPSGTTPLLPPLRTELVRAGLSVTDAPVERQTRRPRLVRRAGVGQYLALAGLSFVFYLAIAPAFDLFEVVTAGISAVVVATVLWRISLTGPVRPVQLLTRLGRLLVYVPYLLWEIAKANVDVAYVVLHPDLPIDPEMVEFDAAVWSTMPVTTLANSITLTPGTLTVDVTRRHFTIHTLTGGSREDLLGGALERAVRFVFYGRAAMRIPSPLERGDDGGEDSGAGD